MKAHSRKNISRKYIAYVAVFLIIVGLSYWTYSYFAIKRIGPVGSQHIHADFKLYINDQPVNFSQNKYQISFSGNQFVHMEGGDGNLIHVHAVGITLGDWLNSVKIYLDSNCLMMDDGSRYCNSGGSTLKMFVRHCQAFGANVSCSEWLHMNPTGDYTIQNLDKILISYGSR